MDAVLKTKLEIIIRLLHEAKVELNLDGRPCDACGLMFREDFAHWQWGQSIDSSITKLDRIIDNLHEQQSTRLNNAHDDTQPALHEGERKTDGTQAQRTARRRR